MPDTGLLLKYLHILAAMVYVTGYISGGVISTMAGRQADWPVRAALTRLSLTFTNKILVPGFIVAGALGVATALVIGYPLTSGWVLYALVIYAVMFVTGIVYWSPLGKKQKAAVDRSDETAFTALARQPSIRIVSTIDGILLLLLIYLMVVKPA